MAAGAHPARRLRAPSSLIVRWGVLVAFGFTWQLIAVRAGSPFLPPMTDILLRVGAWSGAELVADLLPSLVRLLLGWSTAVVAGVVVGAMLGLSRTLSDYVEPVVHFLRAIPPPALIPLLLVLLGTGDPLKVAVIAFGVVWVVLLNTIDGVRSVDDLQLATGRVFGIDRRRQLLHIVLPSALPKIFAALRISLPVAVILMALSEMVAPTDGIGARILAAQRSFRIVDLWAGVVVLGVVGYALNTALVKIEARVLAWQLGTRGVTT